MVTSEKAGPAEVAAKTWRTIEKLRVLYEAREDDSPLEDDKWIAWLDSCLKSMPALLDVAEAAASFERTCDCDADSGCVEARIHDRIGTALAKLEDSHG